jgi:hypothetical protein
MNFAPATLYGRDGSRVDVTVRLAQNPGLPVTWFGVMRVPPGRGPDLKLWSALGTLRLDVAEGPKIEVRADTVSAVVGYPGVVSFVSVMPPPA